MADNITDLYLWQFEILRYDRHSFNSNRPFYSYGYKPSCIIM